MKSVIYLLGKNEEKKLDWINVFIYLFMFEKKKGLSIYSKKIFKGSCLL